MNKSNSIFVAASLYGNPIHPGHLDYLRESKKLGDYLIVIINNDEQVKLKNSIPFMNQEDRRKIIQDLRYVDETIISVDKDLSVAKTLALIQPNIFTNGGDRIKSNLQEKEICEKIGCKMIFGVGGDKTCSSSKLINDAVKYYNKKMRIWK